MKMVSKSALYCKGRKELIKDDESEFVKKWKLKVFIRNASKRLKKY